MVIGIYTFEIHLPESHSLKDKRQVLRRVKDRLRSHLNVAVAEFEDHADLWQRAGVIVVSVASSRDALVSLFETVHRETERHVPGHVIELGSEFIQGEEMS